MEFFKFNSIFQIGRRYFILHQLNNIYAGDEKVYLELEKS